MYALGVIGRRVDLGINPTGRRQTRDSGEQTVHTSDVADRLQASQISDAQASGTATRILKQPLKSQACLSAVQEPSSVHYCNNSNTEEQSLLTI